MPGEGGQHGCPLDDSGGVFATGLDGTLIGGGVKQNRAGKFLPGDVDQVVTQIGGVVAVVGNHQMDASQPPDKASYRKGEQRTGHPSQTQGALRRCPLPQLALGCALVDPLH